MPCHCGKSERARMYCHRPDCGTVPSLPDPTYDTEVKTVTDGGTKTVVLTRKAARGSPIARTYPVTGATEDDRISDAVRRVISDPAFGEFQKR